MKILLSNECTFDNAEKIGRSKFNADDCFVMCSGNKIEINPCICFNEKIFGYGDQRDPLNKRCSQNEIQEEKIEKEYDYKDCISCQECDMCYIDTNTNVLELDCEIIYYSNQNQICKKVKPEIPDEYNIKEPINNDDNTYSCSNEYYRPTGENYCGKYILKDNMCILTSVSIEEKCNCYNINSLPCGYDNLLDYCCKYSEFKSNNPDYCSCYENEPEIIIDEDNEIFCKKTYARNKNENICEVLEKINNACFFINTNSYECFEYELNNQKERKGDFNCITDELYKAYADECRNCEFSIKLDEENKCVIKNKETYCAEILVNKCECLDIVEQDCNNEIYKLCSNNCETETCIEGYHRPNFNSDKCGFYKLEDKKCVFVETNEIENCLGIDGSDSCLNDPIKQITDECKNQCYSKYYKRSSINAYDCFVIDPENNCKEQETYLENCLDIMTSKECDKDPIYSKYSSECEEYKEDNDNDGIDDTFEKQECLNTEENKKVDKYGCSCDQKNCDDNNPCTDDSCLEGECVYTFNNDPCGEFRECPISKCEDKYPFEKWLEYPESGNDYCNEGKCLTYSCDLKSAKYSKICDLDDDDDNDPDEKDPDPDDPKKNSNNEKEDNCNKEPPNCELTLGVCQNSKKICQNNEWLSCNKNNYGNNYLVEETEEHCDGLDNDCDGSIDENCQCSNNEIKECGTNVGQCSKGIQRCVNGIFGECENSILPKEEICNNLDDDCDGLIDEDIFNSGNYTLEEECFIHTCKGTKNCGEDCILINDEDKDNLCIELDNCPYIYNPDQIDSDNDNIGDACDICPSDPLNDIDNDDICDNLDNCLSIKNQNQLDSDKDGIGDACDICPSDPLNDIDKDGVCGNIDNCQNKYNPDQNDCDNNNIGDVCDLNSECSIDSDNDQIKDNIDNCHLIYNPDQKDSDNDNIGDACDICPSDPLNDIDKDGFCGNSDNCPNLYNPNQQDNDNDFLGNECDFCLNDFLNDIDNDNVCGNIDNCPYKFNPNQKDCNKNNIGDACDLNSECSFDSDKDGIQDIHDNCADYYNPDQIDSDNDRIGNLCDLFPYDTFNDIDKDGISGDKDNCPNLYNPNQQDDDNDGLGNNCDPCPNDTLNDIDKDKICGNSDNCKFKFNPDQNDCDNNKIGDACDSSSKCIYDFDLDKIQDTKDNCYDKFNPNQLDKDGDAIGDVCDICPSDPLNDIDNDGVCGNIDNCPAIKNQNQLDLDKDGIGDACDICLLDPLNDIDKDLICGERDNCPYINNPKQKDCENNNIGDACDFNSECVEDTDKDNIIDYYDNCPEIKNQNQLDLDKDWIGDACDICPSDPLNDIDNDGVCSNIDNCPKVYNPNQKDIDNDSIGDACDICQFDENNDIDEDSICGDVDICPFIKNINQKDCNNNIDNIIFDKTIKIKTEEIETLNKNGILLNITKIEDEKLKKLKENIKIETKEYYLDGKKFTKYKITIDSKDINNLYYYQNIPKCLAKKAENLYFNGKNYNIIEKDPLIAWQFSNTQDFVEITYDVEGVISQSCINELKDFIYTSSELKKSKKNLLLILLPLILIPIIIFYKIFDKR